MAYKVKKVVNKTDAEVDVIDSSTKKVERIDPGSSKDVPDENLLNLTFVSKTSRPVYLKVKSIVGGIGDDDGDEPVVVETGDPEEEDDIK